jgi:uncharacterized protein Usg
LIEFEKTLGGEELKSKPTLPPKHHCLVEFWENAEFNLKKIKKTLTQLRTSFQWKRITGTLILGALKASRDL